MLFKGFTTALAAIAISFASFSATPAKADNDAAKIIAGVAAVAIIGAAIANSRDDRRYVTRYHGYHNPYYYGHKRKVYRQHYYNKHGHYHGHGHSHHKRHHKKHW